jgi:hypothetical protein
MKDDQSDINEIARILALGFLRLRQKLKDNPPHYQLDFPPEESVTVPNGNSEENDPK